VLSTLKTWEVALAALSYTDHPAATVLMMMLELGWSQLADRLAIVVSPQIKATMSALI
jgi:hypothetical protein